MTDSELIKVLLKEVRLLRGTLFHISIRGLHCGRELAEIAENALELSVQRAEGAYFEIPTTEAEAACIPQPLRDPCELDETRLNLPLAPCRAAKSRKLPNPGEMDNEN